MKWRFLLPGLLMAALCLPADAQNARAARDTMEARMLVAGSVDIEADGSVAAIALDDLEKLPGPVVDLVERAAAGWRFEPVLVDGVAVPARARMSLKALANKVPGTRDQFAVRLDGTYFGASSHDSGESPTSDKIEPPAYPLDLLRRGVSGTAYLVLKVGRDGVVEDAVAEQVNLGVAGDARAMERWRKALADSALAAARKWTFTGPRKGDEVDAPFWSVRVPVEYRLGKDTGALAGTWEAYIPGPRQRAPWLSEDESSTQPDTLAASGVHPVDPGRRLLTELDPGT